MPSTFGQGFSSGAPSASFKPGAAQPTPTSGKGTQYQAYAPRPPAQPSQPAPRPPAQPSRPAPGTAEYYKSPAFLNHVSGYGGAGMSSERAVGDYQRANAQGLANKDWASAIQTGFANKAGAGYDTRYVNDDMWNQASEGEKSYYMNYGVRAAPQKLGERTDPRSLSQFGGSAFNPLPRPKQPMYQA